MALKTKQNLISGKFEQFSGDTLNISGTTRIYGNLEYAGSAPINPNGNSLASRSYVSGLTATASNGLTKLSNNVTLGGLLTGNTVVDTNNFGIVFGNGSIATGSNSFAEGSFTTSSGNSSHAEGNGTIASGYASHAEGMSTQATGSSSHAEGSSTKAWGIQSHAEGFGTTASGDLSHAEGNQTTASGYASHAEGNNTIASGDNSHSEGQSTVASGDWSHAEGVTTTAFGLASHAEGNNTIASGDFSHAGGQSINVFSKEVLASGIASFNHSFNGTGQTISHGALADRSAILGGQNHNIEISNTGAAIIGGNGIKLTGSSYIDTTAVAKLAIMSTPDSGLSGDTVLVRDSSTGIIKEVTQASIGGSYVSPITANNGLTKVGDNIRLGGSLTGATKIETAFSPIYIGASDYNNGANYFTDGTQVVLTNYSTGTGSSITVNQNTINIESGNVRSAYNFTGITTSFNNGLTPITTLDINGLRYATDFSSFYTNRSLVDKAYVTGLTSSIIDTTTANNGLTKLGVNVRLGGTLTGATTINALNTSNRLSFGAFPIQYVADYSSNYTNRSLTDVGYVTGLTSQRLLTSAFNTYSASTLTNINNRVLTSLFNSYTGATQTALNNRVLTSLFNSYTGTTQTALNTKIDSANNGLTKNGTNVRLGGTLTGSTTIGLGTNNLILSGTTGTLRYATNQSANYNVRSLVDVGYVTGLTSTLSTTANNGINKVGQNFRLGGALTGNTNINLNTFNFNLTGATGTLTLGSSRFAILNPANTFRNIFVSSAIVANRNISIPLLTADDTLVTAAFTQTLTNKTITSPSIGGTVGGSATYTSPVLTTPRFASNGFIADSVGNEQLIFTQTASAINEFRITNAAINTNPIFGASGTDTNVGIDFLAKGTGVYRFLGTATKSAEIRLFENTTGGTNFTGFRAPINLTGDTMYILPNRLPSASGQVLSSLTDGTMSWTSVLSTSAFNTYSANTQTQINNRVLTANNGLTKSGSNVRLGGNLTGATTIGLGTSNLTLTGTTGTLRYGSDLSANYNVRSLPDVGYVTGLTSNVLQDVSSNVTLNNNVTIVLVDTTSSGLTVTLNSSPVNGRVLRIKDKSGNGNVRNITINGNGKNIDGSSTTLINTGYGSIEMVYSSANNSWYIISFVI